MMEQEERSLLLLVDDVPANLHVLAELLRSEYRIKTATNGAAALEIAAKPDQPDLILLDVMMPGMDGIEVLKHLRERPQTKDIPVIFVSADASEQSQLDGLKMGADEYMTKPVISSILRVRVRNILQRKKSEASLRLASHVFNYSGEAIIITDSQNNIIDVNPAFERMSGYSKAEVQGKNPRILSSGRTTEQEYEQMWETILQGKIWRGEVWDRRKDGGVYPKLLTVSIVRNEQGDVDFHIAMFTDLTKQKEAEEKIRHSAHHDALTGLPNRLYLQVNLEQVIASVKREGDQVALMFIDLDRFKLINDTLGHHIGDGLLVTVARRLKECVRESDLVARLGGDEFVIALRGNKVLITAETIAQKILTVLSQAYCIQGHEFYSSPSIGISYFPDHGMDVETLMKNADAAMYQAKNSGRNNYKVYHEDLGKANEQQLMIENNLRQALENHEFEIYYQPQIDFSADRLVGAEALLRWRHPEQGLISAQQFMPEAENNGMILPMGEWVLNQVCAQVKQWHQLGLTELVVSVNLSPRQFRQEQLADKIMQVLDAYELPASAIELEVGEVSIMENNENVVAQLNCLSQHGLTVTIDDFGTGYSSLKRLKQYPVNKLKIDAAFVRHLPDDKEDGAIVSAVIQLGVGLGLQVVAKGVEQQAQWDFLKQHHCDYLQGYWGSRPLNSQDFEQFALKHLKPEA